MHEELFETLSREFGLDFIALSLGARNQLREMLAYCVKQFSQSPPPPDPEPDFEIDFGVDEPRLAPAPITAERIVMQKPSMGYPRLNAITRRSRDLFRMAVELEDPVLKFGTVLECSDPHRPEQGAVQAFLFWSPEIFEPKNRITDERLTSAVTQAALDFRGMLLAGTANKLFISDLKAASPHLFEYRMNRWLLRQGDSFVPFVDRDVPLAGVRLRADVLTDICRFFVSEVVTEYLDGDNWLLVAPGQVALVVRSETRLDDSREGIGRGWVCGNVWRSTGRPMDPEELALIAAVKKLQNR